MKRTFRNSLIALFAFSSAAFAANGADVGQSGLLISLFVGFFALILAFQVVPGFFLFVGMVKGLISQDHKNISATRS